MSLCVYAGSDINHQHSLAPPPITHILFQHHRHHHPHSLATSPSFLRAQGYCKIEVSDRLAGCWMSLCVYAGSDINHLHSLAPPPITHILFQHHHHHHPHSLATSPSFFRAQGYCKVEVSDRLAVCWMSLCVYAGSNVNHPHSLAPPPITHILFQHHRHHHPHSLATSPSFSRAQGHCKVEVSDCLVGCWMLLCVYAGSSTNHLHSLATPPPPITHILFQHHRHHHPHSLATSPSFSRAQGYCKVEVSDCLAGCWVSLCVYAGTSTNHLHSLSTSPSPPPTVSCNTTITSLPCSLSTSPSFSRAQGYCKVEVSDRLAVCWMSLCVYAGSDINHPHSLAPPPITHILFQHHRHHHPHSLATPPSPVTHVLFQHHRHHHPHSLASSPSFSRVLGQCKVEVRNGVVGH